MPKAKRPQREPSPTPDAVLAAAATGTSVPVAATGAGTAKAATASAATVVTGAQVAAAVGKAIASLRHRGLASLSSPDDASWLWLVTALRPEFPVDQVPDSLLRQYAEQEVSREERFWQRMGERLRRDIPTALASGEPKARVDAILRRERRWMAMHQQASAGRVRGHARADQVKLLSPQGGFWRMSPHVKEHTPDCIAMAAVGWWPWSVLDKLHPPVHVGCRCELLTRDEARELGLLGMALPDVSGANDRAAQIMREHGHVQEAYWCAEADAATIAALVAKLVDRASGRGLPLLGDDARVDPLEIEEHFYDRRFPAGMRFGGRFMPSGGIADALTFDPANYSDPRRSLNAKLRALSEGGTLEVDGGLRIVRAKRSFLVMRPDGTSKRYTKPGDLSNAELGDPLSQIR